MEQPAVPRRWPEAVLDRWPDVLEVYRDEATGLEECFFIVNRKNSRSFTMEQELMLQTLERLGLNVKIRYGGIEMTLDQYHSGHAVNTLTRQASYNLRSETKHLERVLEKVPMDDPRRPNLVERLQRFKTKLGQFDVVKPGELQKADDGLVDVEKAMKTPVSLHELEQQRLEWEIQISNTQKDMWALKEELQLLGNNSPSREYIEKEVKKKEGWIEELNKRLAKTKEKINEYSSNS